MQVSGRVIIVAVLALALAMAGGAWWYQYQGSRRAAAFWGREAATLLIASPTVEFLELGQSVDTVGEAPTVAGRAIAATHPLRDKPGLIHLRYVFTQDVNFPWEARRREAIEADQDWAYALRFAERDRALVILLRSDFQEIGKLEGDGKHVDVLPSSRPAAAIKKYLTAIGVLPAEPPAR
jgi:hypothetical protein